MLSTAIRRKPSATSSALRSSPEIGRAHVCTPVTWTYRMLCSLFRLPTRRSSYLQNALNRERIGDEACVLGCSPTKAIERIFCDVVATLDGDLFDRVGHVIDGDTQKAFGNFFCATIVS